jgi:hypothetical protein
MCVHARLAGGGAAAAHLHPSSLVLAPAVANLTAASGRQAADFVCITRVLTVPACTCAAQVG